MVSLFSSNKAASAHPRPLARSRFASFISPTFLFEPRPYSAATGEWRGRGGGGFEDDYIAPPTTGDYRSIGVDRALRLNASRLRRFDRSLCANIPFLCTRSLAKDIKSLFSLQPRSDVKRGRDEAASQPVLPVTPEMIKLPSSRRAF